MSDWGGDPAVGIAVAAVDDRDLCSTRPLGGGGHRRDGIEVKAVDFLKLCALIMPPALLLSLGALLLTI